MFSNSPLSLHCHETYNSRIKSRTTGRIVVLQHMRHGNQCACAHATREEAGHVPFVSLYHSSAIRSLVEHLRISYTMQVSALSLTRYRAASLFDTYP